MAAPRKIIVDPPPGRPRLVMDTPETFPKSAPAAELAGTASISSALKLATLTDNFFLEVAPATPETTISSSWLSGVNWMFIESCPATAIVSERYPIKLMDNVAFSFDTVIEKLPSKSVRTPLFVPVSKTVAPGSGRPSESLMLPVMVVCANAI